LNKLTSIDKDNENSRHLKDRLSKFTTLDKTKDEQIPPKRAIKPVEVVQMPMAFNTTNISDKPGRPQVKEFCQKFRQEAIKLKATLIMAF